MDEEEIPAFIAWAFPGVQPLQMLLEDRIAGYHLIFVGKFNQPSSSSVSLSQAMRSDAVSRDSFSYLSIEVAYYKWWIVHKTFLISSNSKQLKYTIPSCDPELLLRIHNWTSATSSFQMTN
jgi:hypothetical protein